MPTRSRTWENCEIKTNRTLTATLILVVSLFASIGALGQDQPAPPPADQAPDQVQAPGPDAGDSPGGG